MNKEKEFEYKKACVELNEILNKLPKEQSSKIPNNFRVNLIENMDHNYKFCFDDSKGILGQNIMTETEALLVGVYEKYLAPDEEKELWSKYNKICLNEIENKKRKNFNPNDVFQKRNVEKKSVNSNTGEIVVYKEQFWNKVKNIFKEIINKIKKK